MLQGLDTSHHNTLTAPMMRSMSWQHKLYFNFMKASEGVTIQDRKFTTYWQYSRGAGLICSGYHFLRPFSNAAKQAENFLNQYKLVDRVGVLPPVVDIEWANSSSGEQWSQLTPAKRLSQIKVFMMAVENELNVKPIIYTAVNFWETYIHPNCTAQDNDYFAAHPAWIVNLNGKGKIPKPWTEAAFWQTHFGEHGSGSDPYEHLDHDTYNSSLKDLLNLTLPGFSLMNGFPRSWIVYDIQAALKNAGVLNDVPDGYFGPNTEAGVRKFQETNAMHVDGIIDRQVWNKILV